MCQGWLFGLQEKKIGFCHLFVEQIAQSYEFGLRFVKSIKYANHHAFDIEFKNFGKGICIFLSSVLKNMA